MNKVFVLLSLLVLQTQAGPIRGLVDIGTGQEVPDADARYTTTSYVHSALSPYATTSYVHSAISSSSVVATGGYASADFWWPTWYGIQNESMSTSTQTVGDVYALFSATPYVEDRMLIAEVDSRPLDDALTIPIPVWSLVSGTNVAELVTNRLVSAGVDGMTVVDADAGDRGVKRMQVPFPSMAAGEVLENPFAEIEATWRQAVSTNMLEMFAMAATNSVSPYRFCRNSSHGAFVTNWYPNSLQLYGTNGVNTDQVLPTVANTNFFWPELADALRCQTAWRGDSSAHAPYIIVSPSYAVGANHFNKSYSNTWWCFNRETNDFRYAHWDPLAPPNGKINSIRDVSIHRFQVPMPSNMIARVVKSSTLFGLSESRLDMSVVAELNCHNLVTPKGITPQREPWSTGAWSATATDWTTWFSCAWDRWVAETPPEVTASSFRHDTHLWDSGHGLYWWINGNIVLVGSWTYATGGPNCFPSDELLDAIDSIIRTDSGGAEGLWFMSVEEIQ